MKVSQAVAARRSVRAFLPEPVPTRVIKAALEKAARAPSGGNLQPWHVAVVNEEAMVRLRALLKDAAPHPPHYQIYPSPLIEPYRTRRYENGMGLYDTMGIAREDKAARADAMARNYVFFDAPAAIFAYIDQTMGPPQWSDLGMFLQTFMLLVEEAGYQTCAQEAWATHSSTIDAFVEPEEGLMLFCGIAIGREDKEAQVNRFRTTRAPTDEWIKVL